MCEVQTTCGFCGDTSPALVQFNRGERSFLICPQCVTAEEEKVSLALAIVAGTAPATTPDFGSAQDAAVKMACALFPDTFGLRGHAGTFRVNVRNSYVSRGKVLVYTERLVCDKWFVGPTLPDQWVDFAKGTIAELKSQIKPAAPTCPICGASPQCPQHMWDGR